MPFTDIYLEGGSYDGGGEPILPPDSGSSGGAQAAAANVALITATGGLLGYESALLIPMYDPEFNTYYIGSFNWQDFNCEEDCEYWFKQENIVPGKKITVTSIRLVYRDLGKVKVTAYISNAQERDYQKGKNGQTKTIGGKADGNLYTEYFTFVCTGERPQIRILRKANEGPLSIVEAYMVIGVENADNMGKGKGK